MACFVTFITLYSFLIFSASLNSISGAFIEEFSEAMAIEREEKTTHLHFFFHDIISSKHPSAVRIAGQPESTLYTHTHIYIYMWLLGY
jgi:hypothetical protein